MMSLVRGQSLMLRWTSQLVRSVFPAEWSIEASTLKDAIVLESCLVLV